MKRRHWLSGTLALATSAASVRLFAAPAAGSRFLLVFLRGGYDAANVLVPVGSSFYYEARPTIAIARPSSDAASAIALNADWGLHPALRNSIGAMMDRREATFIPFSGTEDLTRSHFETQDSIEMGQPVAGHRDFRSGFMNRLAEVLQGAVPISFTDQLPMAFRGPAQVSNYSLRSLSRPVIDARQSAIIASMYQGNPLAAQVKEGFSVRADVTREMDAEMQAASRNAISPKGFEAEAVRVARLMRDRYSLGFIDVGGWDTHVGQGGATGYLASHLEELGRGLAAFASEMGPAWRQTTVVVISEFGRTFRENGNLGTDHGHGSVMWVLGGSPKPGPVAGEQVAVSASSLLQNRDWPVLNDYRGVLGGIFEKQFGLGAAQLQKVFPGAAVQRLNLV